MVNQSQAVQGDARAVWRGRPSPAPKSDVHCCGDLLESPGRTSVTLQVSIATRQGLKVRSARSWEISPLRRLWLEAILTAVDASYISSIYFRRERALVPLQHPQSTISYV